MWARREGRGAALARVARVVGAIAVAMAAGTALGAAAAPGHGETTARAATGLAGVRYEAFVAPLNARFAILGDLVTAATTLEQTRSVSLGYADVEADFARGLAAL